MKEFIFGIEEENSDYAEVFYGWIRNHSPELIRCRDCKNFRKAEDHAYRYRDSCDDPHGLVRPVPEGFCNYGEEKDSNE